jgi:hypothetical protein
MVRKFLDIAQIEIYMMKKNIAHECLMTVSQWREWVSK